MAEKHEVAKATKKTLVDAADYFGVDVKEEDKVADLRERFVDDGVTDEMFTEYLELKETAEKAAKERSDEDIESSEEPEEDKILLKMERKNPSMSIKGHSFTQRHPYQLVPASDAEFIILNYKGFRQALPAEVERYYS